MDYPSLSFHIKNEADFNWSDGFQELTDSHVQTLFEQCSSALNLLKSEIDKRQLGVRQEYTAEVSNCSNKLLKDVKRLKVLERLGDRDCKMVKNAVDILSTSQTSREQRVYQEFLHDILHHSNRGLLLLCAASLGKQRVTELTVDDRLNLVLYVKKNQALLDCPVLEHLADFHQVPTQNAACKVTRPPRKRARNEGAEAVTQKSDQSLLSEETFELTHDTSTVSATHRQDSTLNRGGICL
ncbi:MAG: hypothetical protein M1814_002245 [Vezdaea aestivalis]|nr:MAG: hypothetical protein M1814_002245 [Vezdaea aestivalis]